MYRIAVIVSPGTAAPFVMLDYISAFIKQGYDVFTLDIRPFFTLSDQEDKFQFLKRIEKDVKLFSPHFAVGYNIDTCIFLPKPEGEIHLFENLKIPYISLFYDNPMTPGFSTLMSPVVNSDLYTVFIWDHYYLDQFMQKYGKKAHFLPLASNPDVFFPRSSAKAFECDIGFIGSISLTDNFDADRKKKGWDQWFVDFARQVIDTKRINKHFPLGEIINAVVDTLPETSKNAILNFSQSPEFDIFFQSVNSEIGSINRYETIQSIPAELKTNLYGTQGWKRLHEKNLSYKGKIEYHSEAPAVYTSSRVNLNITSTQLVDSVNQRVFDVPACEGFLLTDNCPSLPELFEPDIEIVVYDDLKDMKDKLIFYLNNDTQRNKIARRARKRFLAHHTYQHRVQQIISVLKENKIV